MVGAIESLIELIHMAAFVSQWLNILCMLFKIKPFFIITLFTRLYVMVGILLTCGKHWSDRIISLRREVWAYKTSLTLPLLIEVPVPGKWAVMCLCVKSIDFASFYHFAACFWNSSDSVVFFVFPFNVYIWKTMQL